MCTILELFCGRADTRPVEQSQSLYIFGGNPSEQHTLHVHLPAVKNRPGKPNCLGLSVEHVTFLCLQACLLRLRFRSRSDHPRGTSVILLQTEHCPDLLKSLLVR